MKKIIVLASTFPLSNNDPTPSFVMDQIVELKKKYNDIEFTVLAPSYQNKKYSENLHFNEYRFTGSIFPKEPKNFTALGKYIDILVSSNRPK